MSNNSTYTTPDSVKPISGTLKSFKSVQAFFDFFDVPLTDDKVLNSRQTYTEVWAEVYANINTKLRNRDVSWFGEPFPISIEDAIQRKEYLQMDDYKQIYNNLIAPRIQEILKKSSIELEVPALKYNDLGLGTFDFNKASAGLIALYKYYSFKKKSLVEGNDVITYKDKDKYKYKLKSDGSEVILIPEFKGGYESENAQKALKDISKGENVFAALKKYGIRIGGKEAFSSTIKKTYILKEKKLKPKNAIRIFVQIGNDAGTSYPGYKFTGYTAIGIAQILTMMGYAVSIIGIIGIRENTTRYYGITLKRFDETLDTQSILYLLSDPTFFRIKFFEVIVKGAQYYKDYTDAGLGYPSHLDELKHMVFSEYGKRDGLFNPKGEKKGNSEFLYYIISDVLSEQKLSQTILDISLNAVNENIHARARLLGDEDYELVWNEAEKKVERRDIKN
jgi:hypothetical protein